MINKVVLEPNERAPERIQVWGAFIYGSRIDLSAGAAQQTTGPIRGYYYYKLPDSAPGHDLAKMHAAVRSDWSILKSVAGTEKLVSYIEVPNYLSESEPFRAGKLHGESEPPGTPDKYPFDYAASQVLVNLSILPADDGYADILSQLKLALKQQR